MHDLMQGIGVARDYRNDESGRGNINGEGFRGFRGWLAPRRFPEDQASAAPCRGAARLNYSRYFNPERTYNREYSAFPPQPRVQLYAPSTKVLCLSALKLRTRRVWGVALLLDHNGTTLEEMRLRGSLRPVRVPHRAIPAQIARTQFFIDVFDGPRESADKSPSLRFPRKSQIEPPGPQFRLSPSHRCQERPSRWMPPVRLIPTARRKTWWSSGIWTGT